MIRQISSSLLGQPPRLVSALLCVLCFSCEKSASPGRSDAGDVSVERAQIADLKAEMEHGSGADLGVATAADLSRGVLPDWSSERLAGLSHRPLDAWQGCQAWLSGPEAKGKLLDSDPFSLALVRQVSPAGGWRTRDGYHEGYNRGMRGKGDIREEFVDDGDRIALRWRRTACGMGGFFVLRDALFNQQDHPVAQRQARALMMPPSWVVEAAWMVRRGETIDKVKCAPIEDDAAWAAIAQSTPEEAFGSFDPSSSIFSAIGAPLSSAGAEGSRARNARESMCALAGHVSALEEGAARGGWQEVLATGAERIAWGDREYFGEALRREVFIPIFVENPDAHERGEGKGLEWRDFGTLYEAGSEEEREALRDVVRQARKVLYGRRLEDGPLALERYDLSHPLERARLEEVLRDLAPRHTPPRHDLWIWVTGKLDEGKKLEGENALAYLADFKKTLSGEEVALDRVRWLSKPAVHVDRKIALERRREIQREALTAHRDAGLELMSVTEVARPE